MSYINVYCCKKTNVTHLWTDSGYEAFPTVKYAYRKRSGGQYKSLYGDELEKITEYEETDFNLFESDVPLEVKCLIDRFGESDDISTNCKVLVLDIEVSTEGGFPVLEEADKAITAIAMYDQVADKYYSYILDPDRKIQNTVVGNVETRSFRTEEGLLNTFLLTWEEIQPSIVTGWNSNGFDMPYIYTRIRNFLGKDDSYRLSPVGISYKNPYNQKVTIAGVSLMDYMELYKKFIGVMKPSWSLANVAKDEELHVQKLTYKGSLNDLYKSDIVRYVEYNLTDVKVVVELDKKYDFIHLARSVCHKGHVPYEWFAMSSRFIDGAILTYLRKNNLVAPNKPVDGRQEYEEMEAANEDGFQGAYVKEPVPGIYDWIYSVDITSLYPSAIMTLNISPDTKMFKILNWDKDAFDKGELLMLDIGDKTYTSDEFSKLIKDYKYSISSNGVVYKQDHIGIIPTILDQWFAERVQYRKQALEYGKQGDKEKEAFFDRRQKRQKIFLNSVYGVLGLPIFRFYDRDNAEATTLSGQTIIKSAEKLVNELFLSKLKDSLNSNEHPDFIKYIDTDSLYISSLPLAKFKPTDKSMKQFTIDLSLLTAKKINEFYEELVPRVFNVNKSKNRIKIVPDVVAERAIWVAKKRYAMLKVYDMEKSKDVKDKSGKEGKLEVKGIDTVRSSFPPAFQKMASDILESILRGVSKDIIDEKIMSFEEKLDSFTIYDLAKTSSAKFISQDHEHNYNPSFRKIFEFIKATPSQVKAALAYNDLLKSWKLDKKYTKIDNGAKIKWVYLLPNDFNIQQLAMKADDTDPDEILNFITEHIDRKKMYERELYKKLFEIYSCINWLFPNRGSQLASTVFNFNDTW